jgi:dihydrodipicolinate synthase/N-acetylneuraminate lyase
MKTDQITLSDLQGVFSVPSLARNDDAQRSLNFAENDKVVRHIASGGITRFLYGGNAFLYHISLRDYAALLEWMASYTEPDFWMIPSFGPSFGRAQDQAELLSKYKFPTSMLLPCADPRDAAGLERGIRELADAVGTPLVLYLKEEHNFGANKEAGLDVVARLVNDGLCSWIKYAVVRQDPSQDAYLDALLQRVPRELVVSGIGERPAIVHLRDFGLAGFTTGTGCLQPRMSQQILEACLAKDWVTAESLREHFIPHEDLRDAWNPAKVLHHATALAGIAETGPLLPFLSPLNEKQVSELQTVALQLVLPAK